MSPASAPYRSTFLVLAVAVLLSGLGALLDVGKRPYDGFTTDGNNTVIQVRPGSPAEAGGLQVGDKLVSVGGIGVEDSKAQSHQPRATVGEARTLVVQRNGSTANVDIQYSALPSDQRLITYLGMLVGLCFLVFGLRAYLSHPAPATTLLALMGLGFGWTFLGTPYSDLPILRNLIGLLGLAALVLSFAVLLHFLLVFPVRRPYLDRPGALRWIYAPATLIAVIVACFIIFQPASTSGVNVFFRIMFGVFVLGYFGASLVTLIGRYARATPAERSGGGLNLMLFGTILGLGPILIGSIVNLVSPVTVLPGSDYYIVLFALIPITFAMATASRASAG